MAVCFLTPIYTSSEKRPLISDHIKGPLVAAFRSPLMKAIDRSIEALGLLTGIKELLKAGHLTIPTAKNTANYSADILPCTQDV